MLLPLLLGCFALLGVTVGAQGVLWAELMPALRLSEGVFGTSQLVPPLVAIGFLLAGGRLSASFGNKRLALAGLALFGGSTLGLAGTAGLAGFVGALALAGAGSGLLETSMNAAVLDWEQATGGRAMNVMHAAYSAGAVLGALGAGALLGIGWTYPWVLVALAALAGLVVVATGPVRFPTVPGRHGPSERPADALRLLRSRPALVVLALLGILGIVGESAANTWSVIHLRGLGAGALVGGAAFALFNGAMCVGRLANARLVAAAGTRGSLLASGVGLVSAALLLAVPDGVSAAVGGLLLLGLAVAGIVPTILSAGADIVPGASGAVAGAILAAAYLGFIVCPPIIGWLAEWASLRVAWLTLAAAGGAVLWLAGGLRPTPSRPEAAASGTVAPVREPR